MGFIAEHSSERGDRLEPVEDYLHEETLPSSNERSPVMMTSHFSDHSFEQSPSVLELLGNKDSSAFLKHFKWVVDRLDLQHPCKLHPS